MLITTRAGDSGRNIKRPRGENGNKKDKTKGKQLEEQKGGERGKKGKEIKSKGEEKG